MTKNTSAADFAKHMKSITDIELWELVVTGREMANNTGAADDVITRDKNEYCSHALD